MWMIISPTVKKWRSWKWRWPVFRNVGSHSNCVPRVGPMSGPVSILSGLVWSDIYDRWTNGLKIWLVACTWVIDKSCGFSNQWENTVIAPDENRVVRWQRNLVLWQLTVACMPGTLFIKCWNSMRVITYLRYALYHICCLLPEISFISKKKARSLSASILPWCHR